MLEWGTESLADVSREKRVLESKKTRNYQIRPIYKWKKLLFFCSLYVYFINFK